MSALGQTGSRIRDKRVEAGIRQADLAKRVGISASYLNLIEHNRRRIAGKLLADIAHHLEVAPEALSQGVDASLLEQLRAAAVSGGPQSQPVEMDRITEFAGRYSGWAGLIASQSDQLKLLQAQIRVLNDRLTYDPTLAHALHDVISAVTAIRSSASILVGGEELDADWQARFHKNVYDDSVRLAQNSERLISYLEAPKTEDVDFASPAQMVEAWVLANADQLAQLEAGSVTTDQVLQSAALPSEFAQSQLAAFLQQYIDDAKALSLTNCASAAKASGYDPLRLSQEFGVPIPVVMRRMASLPDGDGHPQIGLVTCDASGTIDRLLPISGFTLPRNGAACPIWPLYAAFSRPEQPVRSVVELPGRDRERFMCYAFATGQVASRFDAPPVLKSTMIVISEPAQNDNDPLELGVTCPVCPRSECLSRREPSIILAG